MNHIVVNTLPAAAQKNAVKQKGYSIIELSIALAIVSIILVGALSGVTKILQSNNVNNDVKHLNTVASRIAVLMPNVGTTTGITTLNLVNLRVFDGMKVDAVASPPTITNSFGGAITISPNTAAINGVGTGKGFLLQSTNIPAAVCGEYITALAPVTSYLHAATGVTIPAATGGALPNGGTTVKSNGGPLTTAGLATVCTTKSDPIHVSILIGDT